MFSSWCEDQKFIQIYRHKLYQESLRRKKFILHKMIKDAYIYLQISHETPQIVALNINFSLS